MDRTTKHNKAMAKQKAAVDDGIAKADVERGVSVLLTAMARARPAQPLAWSCVRWDMANQWASSSSSKASSLQARKSL